MFEPSVENVPAADTAPPITTPSIAPPLKSTTSDVRFAPVMSPPVICAFTVFIVENVPTAATVPPMIVPSIAPPLISAPAVVIVENVDAADAFAPITTPSIAPPFRSTESDASVEKVPAADADAPITVPSIVPPSTSADVAESAEIVIAAIVPPSTLSPEIWSSASTRDAADTSTVSPASDVRPAVTTPSFMITPSAVTPAPTVCSAIVSADTVPEKSASEPEIASANEIPAPDRSLIVSTEIASIACEPIFRSASAVPTLNSQTSSVSFHCSVAESSVPRSISIPAVPAVTPAAVSPLLRTIELSAISVFVVFTDVSEPDTVRLPAIATSAPNDTSASATVICVEVALSSIPVDAKSEIEPPSILSPEIESLSNVSVLPVISISVPEIVPPEIAAPEVVIVENVPAADVVAPITVASTVPPLMSAVVAVRSANVEAPVAATPASFSTTPSISTPVSSVFSLIVSTVIVPALIVPAFEIPAFATLIPCVVTISELNVMSPPFVNASIVSTFSVPEISVSANEAFAAVVAPITVPSMLPPFRSTESEVNVSNVPAADVVAPITTPSIAEPSPPSTSNVPSTSSVLPAPTVMSNCEIVLPVPP